MRERDIERYLVRRVKELGGEIRKVKWIGRRGAPDRVVMLPWRLVGNVHRKPLSVWVELKATGKKPELYQLREHERMQRRGMHVVWLDSRETVDALLA